MPAHQSYASYLVAQRRFAEAISESRRGWKGAARPRLSARVSTSRGCILNRQYDAALHELQTIVQMDPTFAFVHFRIGQVRLVTRR